LDGEPIELTGRADEGSYVPRPFSPMPAAPNLTGPKQRPAPYALWTAMQLAAGGASGSEPQTVLVSLSEQISNFAGWWLALLDGDWPSEVLPDFFQPPRDAEARMLWERTLATCGDLFGSSSREYRLLKKGIVVHHGRMPGRLPRLLTGLVERQIVRIVLATSTLSQGVNLPVQTVLVPFLSRYTDAGLERMSGREFGNLIGRAGRPGVSTEGQALVLLVDTEANWRRRRARADYNAVVRELAGAGGGEEGAESPLARLIEEVVRLIPGGQDAVEDWLESTAPAEVGIDALDDATRALDALDSILIAAMEDSDQAEVEDQLRRFWESSFAHYASATEAELQDLVLRRGRALAATVYPVPEVRRRYYKTALPPREAQRLIDLTPVLVEHLQAGDTYGSWSAEERLGYVEGAVELVGRMERFRIPETIGGSKATWDEALRWWFRMPELRRVPTITQVARWHDYLQQELRYRFTWGLGAALALAADESDPQGVFDAEASGLPWAAVWIKDLLTWGTLDPAAAYLLARGVVYTRDEAESLAAEYYAALPAEANLLDPGPLRRWVRDLTPRRARTQTAEVQTLPVDLLDEVAAATPRGSFRVLPSLSGTILTWLDPAGFPLARSERPTQWARDLPRVMDFTLDIGRREVTAIPYV
jgi:hypothetical protein